MDDNYIVNRIVNILNSESQNLVKGNISSPRPGSICQVSTDYGIKDAYNINCTYPGDAYVVWDKEEECYYCFTDKPSEVVDSRQLSYRKHRKTEKILEPVYALLYKKDAGLLPVNGYFYVTGSNYSDNTVSIANYSGSGQGNFGAGDVLYTIITNDETFKYPDTIMGSAFYSTQIAGMQAVYSSANLTLSNVYLKAKPIYFNITGSVQTTAKARSSVSLIVSLGGTAILSKGYPPGGSGVNESFYTSPSRQFSNLTIDIELQYTINTSDGYTPGTCGSSLNFQFSEIEYEPAYNLYLYSNNKSIKIYDDPVLVSTTLAYSITSLKDKILLTIKDQLESNFQRIIQRSYDYSLNLKEENIYIYETTVPSNNEDWLNSYNKSYRQYPTLPTYISDNLNFLSNLIDDKLIYGEVTDENKIAIGNKIITIPVKIYDIVITPYSKKLKNTKTLKLSKIEKAILVCLSIFKL